ncbi:DUF202 domain-containing protein [Cryobacterium tagatosivorans]|uniref:DUF202 domain-containing protein n=1 Tax=Cryobacterium tagatosivorans TaxID=1259199 RepID=A0A4V3I6W7_9MICO|nr:DUF202 domain-containing protein [Cryobacterium tagatosivorans]TFB56730.1 DUF202 domain-containing protein [Cryobacterium tagatosivorans]
MSGTLDRPFDVGLQAERTALSWQRTTLSSAVGFLVAARLLVVDFGILSILVAATGLLITAMLFVIGHRRYRSAHAILVGSSGKRVALTSAVPLFAWAVVVFSLAVFGLAFTILIELAG